MTYLCLFLGYCALAASAFAGGRRGAFLLLALCCAAGAALFASHGVTDPAVLAFVYRTP